MNIKVLLSILLIAFTFNCLSQDSSFVWKGKLKTEENSELKFAHIQVRSENQYYLFMSDEEGLVDIRYPGYSDIDSVIISCIGYKTKKLNCSELIDQKSIILETDIYQIGEVVITPVKEGKIVKLGNRHNTTIKSSQIGFEDKKGLFIPGNEIKGKIKAVRVYMHDFSEKKFKYRPIRLRLYKGSPPNIEEILKEEIIASLQPKKSHWIEIDISRFDIDLPTEGVFVVIEALSFDYYKTQGYIKQRYINSKLFNARIDNSVSIGSTSLKLPKNHIKSWRHYGSIQGWIPEEDRWYYLIQIKVELKEKDK